MKPFFSVIIPTLNEQDFLPRLLSDIQKQKYRNFEVIIVDADSPDHTRAVARQFKQYFALKVVKVKPKNVSYQRNIGAEKAKGEYLTFLDADSTISAPFLRNLERSIRKEHGLIFIPVIQPYDTFSGVDTTTILVIQNLVQLSHYSNRPFSAGGNIVFHRQTFLHIGGFDQKLVMNEDHDLIRRAYRWGIRAKFNDSVRVGISLRRLAKEGRLKVLYKYLISIFFVLTDKKMKKKMFSYEMGGDGYKKVIKQLSILKRVQLSIGL